MNDEIELDYDYLMQKALRRLICDVLTIASDIGDAPGEHHFYIEFMTQAPGVSIPDHLKEDYPHRMTIVMQHQFQELTVDEEQFAVTLWFKGKEARLVVPFDAVTSFIDPSVDFKLRFEPVDAAAAPAQKAKPETPAEEEAPAEPAETKKEGADIVSLDSFRKK